MLMLSVPKAVILGAFICCLLTSVTVLKSVVKFFVAALPSVISPVAFMPELTVISPVPLSLLMPISFAFQYPEVLISPLVAVSKILPLVAVISPPDTMAKPLSDSPTFAAVAVSVMFPLFEVK